MKIKMLSKDRLNNLASEIWKGAIKLRGKFKAYEYQAVILPMIMIRRIETMLQLKRYQIAKEILRTNPKITKAEWRKKIKAREKLTISYHNTTDWTLARILKEDSTQTETNFRDYLKGFSPIMQEIIDQFNYRETVGKMVKANRLESIIKLVADEDLSPRRLSNLEMGYVYEELLQRFTQDDAKDTGEHFTPREIIRIMVDMLGIDFNPAKPEKAISIYDPACGTGGMLSVAKEHLLDKCTTKEELENVQTMVQLFGQEYLSQNYAVCKTDMLLRGDLDNTNEKNITYGNSLIPDIASSKERGDLHHGSQFDYMISNPPFGVDWSEYATEANKFKTSRYKAGMPPSNDGALLFLLSMIEKMKDPKEGGSKISILFNGSPLSNGDCGGGESEIRRQIIEGDLLEAIIMLPDQMFYNTGIYTYVWLLNNNKPKKRKGEVLIINGRQQFEKEPKSFGNKRNRITDDHRQWIRDQYKNWKETEDCKIFKSTDFAYHKVKVLFWQTDENDEPLWIREDFPVQLNNSNVTKKFDLYGDFDMDVTVLTPADETLQLSFPYNNEVKFDALVKKHLLEKVPALVELAANEYKTWLAECKVTTSYYHRHYIEDNEYITHGTPIEPFLKKEIDKPIIRWDYAVKQGDNEVLGYEILPNKYFFKYVPPISSEKLMQQFWKLEEDAERILKQMKELA
jgi:type I restriction enzyme M protein